MFQVTPLRRLVVTALAVCAAVIAPSAAGPVSAQPAQPARPGSAAAAGGRVPLAPPPVREEDRAGDDHLTVTVRHAGGGADGTFEVHCHPARGSHPDPDGACGAVDRNTRWGRDAFAPVAGGELCTMRYGGPATAQVTGRWAGRPVDATFDRGNGCQIERWDRFVPLLPGPRPASGGAVAEAPVP